MLLNQHRFCNTYILRVSDGFRVFEIDDNYLTAKNRKPNFKMAYIKCIQ